MNYLKTSLLAIFSITVNMFVHGQNEIGFQRYYGADDFEIINITSTPLPDNGYLLASISENLRDTSSIQTINITIHDVKGNIIGSNDYEIEGGFYSKDLRSLSIELVEDNSLFFVASTIDTLLGPNDEKHMIKLDADNNVIWSNSITDSSSSIHAINSKPVAILDDSQRINVFSTQLEDMTYGIHHNRFNNDNSLVLSQTYVITDTISNPIVGGILDADLSVDSTYSIVFLADSTQQSSGFLKVNDEGVPMSALSYRLSSDTLTNSTFELSSISSLPDTTSAMVGSILDNTTNNLSTVIIKTNKEGNIVWSKILNTNIESQTNDLIVTNQNEIAVSGKYSDFITGNIGDYTIFFNMEGEIIRQVDHGSINSFRTNGLITPPGHLSTSSDGSTFYSTTGIDLNGGVLGNYMIKMDSIGNAMCSDTFSIGTVTDINLVTDTLNVDIDNFGILESLEVEQTNFGGFNTPVLTLTDTTFCPQDPIVFEIIGTVPGATDYIWSTGDTTDRITVMEEGEFSVTVTVGDRVCYMLCDTSNVSQLDFPEAQLDVDPSFFCEEGFVRLSGTLTAGAGARDYIWDDNSTERTRDVTGPGTYSVTITDNCDNTAVADVILNDSNFSVDVTASINQGAFDCDNGVQLSVTTISPFPIQSILWSTGETTETISVLNSGDYSVTVTNICSASDQDSTVVSIADFSDLTYPNVFFPTSEIDINRTFGPYIECPELTVINEYSLEIFNRWGDKVYESDRVIDRWNGRINNMGDIIQEDVYLFVYTYLDEAGLEIKGNGSVTLSRQ